MTGMAAGAAVEVEEAAMGTAAEVARTDAKVAGTQSKVGVVLGDAVILTVVCGVGGSDDEMTGIHVGICYYVIRTATIAPTACSGAITDSLTKSYNSA